MKKLILTFIGCFVIFANGEINIIKYDKFSYIKPYGWNVEAEIVGIPGILMKSDESGANVNFVIDENEQYTYLSLNDYIDISIDTLVEYEMIESPEDVMRDNTYSNDGNEIGLIGYSMSMMGFENTVIQCVYKLDKGFLIMTGTASLEDTDDFDVFEQIALSVRIY